jgi:dTDP-4-dehydrorhamnose 3,5-epimerase
MATPPAPGDAGTSRLPDFRAAGPAVLPSRATNAAASAPPGIVVVRPRTFSDARGYFFESYHAERYAAAGVVGPFVQDNVSLSRRGVLRGLHLQHPRAQGKLVHVLRGAVWDVAVDVRVGSPTFGRWVGEELSADNGVQLYVPPGFAHGFVVTADEALVAYKCTAYYDPASELALRWDDPDLAVAWPVEPAVVGERDQGALSLAAALARGVLPHYERGEGAPGGEHVLSAAAVPGTLNGVSRPD